MARTGRSCCGRSPSRNPTRHGAEQAILRELETIVLKALEKNPAERYRYGSGSGQT